jgi:phage terminase small subunit
MLRQPDSVRGLREGITIDKPESKIDPPDWLSRPDKKEFKILVRDLTAANVPIKQVDSFAIACCAQCIAAVSKWTTMEQEAETLKDKLECSKQVARYQRDSQKWAETIGATPAARARFGIRSAPKKTGKLAQLIALKKEQ